MGNVWGKIHTFVFCVLGTLALVGCGSQSDPGAGGPAEPVLTGFAKLEKEVTDGLNSLRREPQSHVPALDGMKKRFNGFIYTTPDGMRIRTNEGSAAVEEAAQVLRGVSAQNTYLVQNLLRQAASDHQKEQEKSGAVGHYGPDGSGPGERVQKYASFSSVGENIAYGNFATGIEIVYGLFVDDGVADRGHRQNMLEPNFREMGVACGPHPTYIKMCVVNYGTDIRAVP